MGDISYFFKKPWGTLTTHGGHLPHDRYTPARLSAVASALLLSAQSSSCIRALRISFLGDRFGSGFLFMTSIGLSLLPAICSTLLVVLFTNLNIVEDRTGFY